MTPIADILNGRDGCDDVCLLFDSQSVLTPHSGTPILRKGFIKHGEQIRNTYGDSPNADL